MFQYPLMDRLGFWGYDLACRLVYPDVVSVSADGSTWFLGRGAPVGYEQHREFQYPLMDRLGFWGDCVTRPYRRESEFQYPLMDRLGFWGSSNSFSSASASMFQYPLMDRLGFWGGRAMWSLLHQDCFSIR